MKTILVDCDGVVADYVGGVLRDIQHALRLDYRRSAVVQYDLWKAINVTGLDKKYIIDQYITQPGWCQGLAPMPGAIEAVRELNEIAPVTFLTSLWESAPTWVYDRNRWLRKHFGSELGSRVIYTNSGGLKRLVRGAALVDDRNSNCEQWRVHNHSGRVFLWPAPYNPESHWSWDDVMEYARGL